MVLDRHNVPKGPVAQATIRIAQDGAAHPSGSSHPREGGHGGGGRALVQVGAPQGHEDSHPLAAVEEQLVDVAIGHWRTHARQRRQRQARARRTPTVQGRSQARAQDDESVQPEVTSGFSEDGGARQRILVDQRGGESGVDHLRLPSGRLPVRARGGPR